MEHKYLYTINVHSSISAYTRQAELNTSEIRACHSLLYYLYFLFDICITLISEYVFCNVTHYSQ